MSTEIRVRTAVETDLENIVTFNLAMAAETESKGLDEVTLRNGVLFLIKNPRSGFYLVAELKDGESTEIAGSLMITFEWSDWRNAIFWWVQSVYVKPALRRRGVYSTLYKSVRERARSEGNICGFRLYVEKENRIAQETYRNLGMTESHYLMYEEEYVSRPNQL